MVDRKIIEKTSNYIQYLIDNGININKAFLYGSYARGEENIESDIDIMIISKEFDNYNDKQIGKLWRITKNFDYKIEPFIVGYNKFDKDDISPIIQVVKNDGIEISIINKKIIIRD